MKILNIIVSSPLKGQNISLTSKTMHRFHQTIKLAYNLLRMYTSVHTYTHTHVWLCLTRETTGQRTANTKHTI